LGDIDNQKFQQIVATAKTLFYKFGIRRVTIEEICREANVSKMTFYKHFSNKVELVKFLIKKMTNESMAAYRKIMDQPISFSEKVKQSVQLKMEGTENLSQEFFLDIHRDANPEILQLFDEIAQKNINEIINDYVEAQKKGEIRSDIKPEFIHFFLNHMFTLAEDENLSRLYESPQAIIMELTNFFFYGILPREEDEKRSKNVKTIKPRRNKNGNERV
jgi:AcrR family transcriptional regulator